MNIVKERVLTKKTAYTLCFFALMIIDWTRGSQVGSTWAWTVNMTGIVMALILICKKGYKAFFKPIYLIYSLVCIGMLFVMYLWWNLHQAAIYRDKLLTAGGNIWFLGLVLIHYIMCRKQKCGKISQVTEKKDVIRICGNYKLEICSLALLLFMWLSVNEDFWPAWYMGIFSLVYIEKYTEAELTDLAAGVMNGIMLGFFFLQGLALLFRPFDDSLGRYAGMYANYNMNALFYCLVWLVFKSKYYYAKKNNESIVGRGIYYLFTSVLLGFLLFTICRTSWIVVVTLEVIMAIVLYLGIDRNKARNVIGKMIIRTVTVLVCIPIIYMAIRYVPTVLHHPIWFEGEYREDKIHSFDPWDSEKYVSFGEWMHETSERVTPYIELLFSKNDYVAVACAQEKEKLTFQSEHFSSSRGRLEIWKYYFENGTWVGHSSKEGHDIYETWYVWHAQNVFIQFWYYYGIPSAILLLVYVGALVITAIKELLKGNDNALLTFQFVLLFFFYGMFEAVWYPGQMVLLLLFLGPLFVRNTLNNEEA